MNPLTKNKEKIQRTVIFFSLLQLYASATRISVLACCGSAVKRQLKEKEAIAIHFEGKSNFIAIDEIELWEKIQEFISSSFSNYTNFSFLSLPRSFPHLPSQKKTLSLVSFHSKCQCQGLRKSWKKWAHGCMMCTSLTCSKRMPLRAGYFDLGG